MRALNLWAALGRIRWRRVACRLLGHAERTDRALLHGGGALTFGTCLRCGKRRLLPATWRGPGSPPPPSKPIGGAAPSDQVRT